MLTAYDLATAVTKLTGLWVALVVVMLGATVPGVLLATGDVAQEGHIHTLASPVPGDTSGEHITEIDHPLWKGRLDGDQRKQSLAAFETEWKKIDFRRGEGGAVYRHFLEDLGVKEIVNYFESKNAFCHGELHDLGALLLERTGNLAISLAMCDDACTYSCTHGVLRQYFSAHKGEQHGAHQHTGGGGSGYEDVQIDTVRDEIVELCRQDSVIIKGFLRGNCAHAIGHAFGIIGGTLKKAQGFCGIFKEAAMQYYCETGVFMEFEHDMVTEFNKELGAKLAGWLKGIPGRMAAAIRYCDSKTQLVSACVRYFIKAFRHYQDVAPLSEECLKLSGVARRSCFFAVGFASVSYVAKNPQDVAKVCGVGDAADQELCVSGLAFLKEGHNHKAAIVAACDKLTAQSLKAVCLDQSQRIYYQSDNPAFEEMLVGQLQKQ
jgi:hypothetical protein